MARSLPAAHCDSVVPGALAADLISSPLGAFLLANQPLRPLAPGGLEWDLLFGNPTRPGIFPPFALVRGPLVGSSGPSLCQVQRVPCLAQDLSPCREPRAHSSGVQAPRRPCLAQLPTP